LNMEETTQELTAIRYSRGHDNFDNTPVQMTSEDFDEFEQAILSDRSACKGTTYFCGPVSFGPHDLPSKFPQDANYRLASHAMPRRFLATDQDGYRDVETFEEVIGDLSMFRGFGYTTWSHTNDKPRSRAVFELNREVSRAEGIALGKAFDRMIKKVYGDDSVLADKSVYQNEQPIYSPGPNAQIFHFNGRVMDVDEILGKFPEATKQTPGALASQKQICVEDLDHTYSKLTQSSIVKVLGLINCIDEPTWFAVSNALARAYGEEGREVFDKFSKGDYGGTPYGDYDASKVNNKYNRSLAELESRPEGHGVRHLLSLAGLSNTEVDFEESAVNQCPSAMLPAIHEPSNFVQFKSLGSNKRPLQTSTNLAAVLYFHQIIARYNQIAKKGEFLVPNLKCVLDETSNTALTIVTDYAIQAGMTSSRIPELLDALASQNPHCPVRTYIDSRPWDGVPRLHQFTDQIKSTSPAVSIILWRKWLIQAVAAAYQPNGISNAGVIVLTGVQNIGKTRLFKDLVSEIEGAFLEGQTLNPADKDSVMSAVSHWVVELGELDATFKKADLAQLKAFITKSNDTLRRPYARKDSVFPRRTVFAGTVNDYHFLHDPTGNRRFWPIDVLSLTRDTNIDYQQLWAQVKTWYDAGEQWYLSDAELSMLNQHNEKFMVTDPDVEALLEHFPFYGCNLWVKKSMRNICTDLDLNTPSKSQTMKLAQAILKHNGGQRPFESNGVKYHWVPDKFSIIQAAKAPQGHSVPTSVAPVAP